jgi:hypothetical protein
MSINDDGDVAFIATYIVAAVTKAGVFFYDTDGSIRSIIHSNNSYIGDRIARHFYATSHVLATLAILQVRLSVQ